MSGGVLSFNIALVNPGGGELTLNDEIGFLEPGFNITKLELGPSSHVALLPGVRTRIESKGHDPGGLIRMDQRRIRLHSFTSVQHRSQHLIVHFNERKGLLRDVLGIGGYGSNGVALVESLVPGHDIVTEMHVVQGSLACLNLYISSNGHVFARYYRMDAWQRQGFAGINTLDLGVSMRAAKYLSPQHACHVVVDAIDSTASDLVRPIVPDRRCANDLVFLVLYARHYFLPPIVFAASTTALTILS